ncbi:MAG: chloride channel protein [Acidimicrobiales bacterium]
MKYFRSSQMTPAYEPGDRGRHLRREVASLARRAWGAPADAEVSLGEPRRRMMLLALFGVILGGVSGVAAFVVVRLVSLISNLALRNRVGFDLPDLRSYHPGPDLIAVAVGGALVVALLALWSPVIKGHGIPESLEAIVLRESRIKPRVLLAKPLSAAVAMGTGGPFGAEGPIIVTGGCIGSLLGQWFRVSAAERRILLATGAAAGMAGIFDTPVAAIIIAFELLLFERSLRALLPLVLATSLAAEIHTLLLGAHPLFAVSFPLSYSAPQLPLFCVVGVASGVLAIVLNKGLFAFEAGFRRLPVPEFFHPLIGAVGFATIGFAVPGSLSVGYWAISDAVNGKFLLGAAAALCVAKLFSWWIALASNTSGGTLAPIFLIGATMGEMLGIGFAHLLPSLHVSPAALAVVAMGATFGAAARAPLTGAVFAIEVTGTFHLLIPMLLALGIAEVVAELGLADRLMTDKLVRRGLRIEFDAEVDPFRTVVAGQAMKTLPARPTAQSGQSVDRFSFLRDTVAIFLEKQELDEVVVTEEGTPVGVISRRTAADVLVQRFAESALQQPTLRRPSGSAHRLRSRVPHAERILRADEAYRTDDGDADVRDAAADAGDADHPDEPGDDLDQTAAPATEGPEE